MDASRIKPPMGHDNAWWWEMAEAGQLGIQKCKGCGALRHPPRPMCGDCHSTEWEAIESTGRGTVCSFTVVRYPEFPGYEYPLIIILVDLEEGTRVTSQLVGCETDDVSFGMAVEVQYHKDSDGFTLPVFRPAGGES